MGQALYRKYRTKTLGDTVGQDHVTTTLTNALKQGRISHAYLLSGPRGVGKTSIARILAHEINGLSYNDEAHLDIIEIDAASNRRIDEIRELRERVNTAPAHAKYKVYIIDEVHMLTKEAFNALLKTLEEPPAHVVFILATTEAHKLPETILSRTQHYTLRPVPFELVTRRLREIADGENITIDDDALELVAKHGEGSFRDSISLLDQASSVAEHVTRGDIERILGLAPDEYIARLNATISSGDSVGLVATLAELYVQGFEPAMVAQQLSATVRGAVLEGRATDAHSSLQLLQKLIDVPSSRNPRQLLEITLLQAALPAASAPMAARAPVTRTTVPKALAPESTSSSTPDASEAPSPGRPEENPTAIQAEVTAEPGNAPLANPTDDTPAPLAGEVDAADLWNQVLETIKKQYNTLYGIARMAHPEFDGQRLILAFKFTFHQKRVNEAKNRKLLADIVEQLSGQPVEIVCVVAETEPTAVKPDVAAISNIFGGAELLNS